ncbi:MAG: enoyl-CoA hydratase-related protein [Alphaproteobacteria bacterium]
MPEILTDLRADGVAVVTISHPERRNACTQAMWRGLGETFRALAANVDARAIVLTGAGETFCAGADISEFATARNNAAAAAEYSRHVDAAETAIHEAPLPVVAAIRGPAIGGGCGLAVACDFRIGGARTRMGIPAARLSVVYSLKETQVLTEVVGARNAKRILFSGDYFDAEESRRLGLLDEIVEDPMAAAIAYASHVAERAPLSVRGAKTAINAIASGHMADIAADYEALRARAADSADYAEGQRAFMEKRKPVFRGA